VPQSRRWLAILALDHRRDHLLHRRLVDDPVIESHHLRQAPGRALERLFLVQLHRLLETVVFRRTAPVATHPAGDVRVFLVVLSAGATAEDVSLEQDLRASVEKITKTARLDGEHGPDLRLSNIEHLADGRHALSRHRQTLRREVHRRCPLSLVVRRS
jgi:hypothetical protein